MVDNNIRVIIASIKNSTKVETPVGGCHGCREWTLISQMIHDSQHIIMRQSFPTHGHNCGISLPGIELAHIVILTKVTLIWIILLGYDSKERCINVGKRLNGTTATSSSSTFEGIRSATNHMLRRKFYEVMIHVIDLGIGCHGRSCSKSPTASTHTLVPHFRDHSLISPINLSRQIFKSNVFSWQTLCADIVVCKRQSVKTTTGIMGHKFLLGQICKFCDTHFPAVTLRVVFLYLDQIFLEMLEPHLLLLEAFINFSMSLFEALKLCYRIQSNGRRCQEESENQCLGHHIG